MEFFSPRDIRFQRGGFSPKTHFCVTVEVSKPDIHWMTDSFCYSFNMVDDPFIYVYHDRAGTMHRAGKACVRKVQTLLKDEVR
jgi:hypothetical protein